MTGFQAFICYSHKDAVWKEQLCDHLASVGLGAAAWHDGNLRGGDAFEERIDAAIDAASLAIVLVSEHSLSSEFITQREVPRLLARRAQDGLRVIPVVVRDCAWKAIPWLASLELRPKGGEPLASMAESDAQRQLAELAEEIHRLVRNNPPSAASPASAAAPIALAPVSVSTGRLPPSGRNLVGRGDELSALDNAWRDPAVTMLTLTAWAGVGKSALVSHWLGQMRREKYRGAERVFGWSFDGQGGARATSADPFFHAALPWFGESSASESSWEKGERLAEAVQRSRTLLVLDGLEPLQHPPGPNEGMLREDGLRAFLCALAECNQGLCVVTSREPILELATYEPDPARHVPLHTLDSATGASLLRALGVRGEESELIATVEEYEGHGLALTLLGSFLVDVFQGDVRRRREVGPLTGDMRLGAHARRVLDSYESWFGEGAEIAALSWLSLMDRPTDEQTLAAVCQEGPANAITEPLRQLSPMQWRQLLGRLQRAHLVRTERGAGADAETGVSAALTQNQTLHLHPLVREHFRERLRAQPTVWQQANDRLFEHCQSQAEEQPATLDGLAPLYDAVRHGCWSGRCREALENVYWPRIRRRNQGYSTRRLGAFQADAAALSHFFVQPYSRVSDELPQAWRAPVLSWTGFRLFALGRLPEAAQALRAALELLWDREERPQAARVANHLFQVSLARGEFRECEALVERLMRDAVADPEIDLPLWRVNKGLLLWQRGQRREAEREFRKATLDDELPLEGHPLSILCRKLPHRQAVQLVFAVTETGDDSLAADYALSLSDSSLMLHVDCSGLSLEVSDYEFVISPAGEDGADSDVQILSIEADSDFQLVAPSDADDSDVQLIGDLDLWPTDDSDVRLAGDSDVRLGDSDVRLGDSDVRLGDSDVQLTEMSDAEGSDLDLASLSDANDSDLRLSDASDSSGFEFSLDDELEQTGAAADGLELAEFLLTADAEASLGEREVGVSFRVRDHLGTLLRAHAEIAALEAAQPTPAGAADPGAPETSPSSPSPELAAVDSLDGVLNELRRAGWSEFVALALILRARRQRLTGQAQAALRDADEAEKLAAYCGLKLLAIDAQLVKASVLIETGAMADARRTLAAATQGAGQVGYHRQAAAARALADRLRQ